MPDYTSVYLHVPTKDAKHAEDAWFALKPDEDYNRLDVTTDGRHLDVQDNGIFRDGFPSELRSALDILAPFVDAPNKQYLGWFQSEADDEPTLLFWSRGDLGDTIVSKNASDVTYD